MQLLVIMDNAINEMHNTGIIARLSGDALERIHNPDANVRITEKTLLAKSVGSEFFTLKKPIPLKNGDMAFLVVIQYDSVVVNAISIAMQGGVESLYTHGVHGNNSNGKMNYYIMISREDNTDITPLLDNIKILDNLYNEYNFKVIEDINEIFEDNEKKKKDLFSKLFKK